ncbi:hypothetical protein AX16_000020 [Volvariella volvacea WC 439]|nr:hypothetical protein AX16_000020 [Volvariella volvacea WC 439]
MAISLLPNQHSSSQNLPHISKSPLKQEEIDSIASTHWQLVTRFNLQPALSQLNIDPFISLSTPQALASELPLHQPAKPISTAIPLHSASTHLNTNIQSQSHTVSSQNTFPSSIPVIPTNNTLHPILIHPLPHVPSKLTISGDTPPHSHSHASGRATPVEAEHPVPMPTSDAITSQPSDIDKLFITSTNGHESINDQSVLGGPQNQNAPLATSNFASPSKSLHPHFPKQDYVFTSQQSSSSTYPQPIFNPYFYSYPHAQGYPPFWNSHRNSHVQYGAPIPQAHTASATVATLTNASSATSNANTPATAMPAPSASWDRPGAGNWERSTFTGSQSDVLAGRDLNNPSREGGDPAGRHQEIPKSGGAPPAEGGFSSQEGRPFSIARAQEDSLSHQTQAMDPAPMDVVQDSKISVDGSPALGVYYPVEGLNVRLDPSGMEFQNDVARNVDETNMGNIFLGRGVQREAASTLQISNTTVPMVVEAERENTKSGIVVVQNEDGNFQDLGSADQLNLKAKPTRKGLIPVVELPLRKNKGKRRVEPLISFSLNGHERNVEEAAAQKAVQDSIKTTNKRKAPMREGTPIYEGDTRSVDPDETDGGARGNLQVRKRLRKKPRTLEDEIFGDSTDEEDAGNKNEMGSYSGNHSGSYSYPRQSEQAAIEVIDLTSQASESNTDDDEGDGYGSLDEKATSISRSRGQGQGGSRKDKPFRRTVSPFPSSNASTSKGYPYSRKPRAQARARRRLPSPSKQRFQPRLISNLTLPQLIEWTNELNRLTYLLEYGKVSVKDSKELDDLLGMINANKENPMLSWEWLGESKLAVALRPFRHKSVFSTWSRGMARDIYVFWSERWEWAQNAGDI